MFYRVCVNVMETWPQWLMRAKGGACQQFMRARFHPFSFCAGPLAQKPQLLASHCLAAPVARAMTHMVTMTSFVPLMLVSAFAWAWWEVQLDGSFIIIVSV